MCCAVKLLLLIININIYIYIYISFASLSRIMMHTLTHVCIYMYICFIIRDNVAYEGFRELDNLQTKHRYKA